MSPRQFSIAPLYGINEKVRVMNARHVTSTRHVFDPSISNPPHPPPTLASHSSHPRNRRVGRVQLEYGITWISWRGFLPSFDERGQILNLSGVPLPKNTSIRSRAAHINLVNGQGIVCCVLKFRGWKSVKCDGGIIGVGWNFWNIYRRHELIVASLISSQGGVDQSYVDGHRGNLYTVCIYCREKGSNAAFRRGTTVEIFKNFLKLFQYIHHFYDLH